jgi:hypothetical protein
MAENSKEKRERAGTDARLQREAEAQAVREKTARLRALRLARDAEAGNNTAAGAATPGKPAVVKKKRRASGDKALSLSDWLTAQQKDGRRN